ncbi:type VI secretion system baseplate subunit TssE [Marinobacterium aestuariivivens]|uniref:Type VI secretion system baseplate subunit TssE n=1 Tax=Marinobacterium aestuariivivens TaxID=1698799 RepID=A0ABW1ZZR4_9GAMM
MLFWKTFLADEDVGDDHDALVASVRHQLGCLLESEAPLCTLPNRLPEVARSNLRFGLDCLQSLSSQMEPDRFAHQLEAWVRAFEPRLTEVRVEVYERDELNNAVSFSLLAKLKTDRGPQALVFDSRLNLRDLRVRMETQDLV